MSRIQALDEITRQLGQPVMLRWVDAPFGAAAVVARFRHRGGPVALSASRTVRLIFHLKTSQVRRQMGGDAPLPGVSEQGSFICSLTAIPERIEVLGSADTVHLLFSPEMAAALPSTRVESFSPRGRAALEMGAVKALTAATLEKPDAQLKETVASIARSLTENQQAVGGLSSGAERTTNLLMDKHLRDGVSVAKLAEAARLSLHHFIKAHQQTTGLTPHALLVQKRIVRAIPLLLTRGARVDEIALRIGFSSSSHFVSAFRRHVGVTPAALQRAAIF